MAQSKIYLGKIRDFGENLGDTFQFIRQEFKPLFRSFLLISGIFMLGAAIVSGVYQMRLLSVFDKVLRPGDTRIFSSIFSGTYFLVLLLTFVGLVAMKLSIASYMKLYERTGSSPSLEEVWGEFRRHILSALLLTLFMTMPLILVGLVLCVLPGFYLMVVFAPAVMILVNEEVSAGQAFSRCFELVKENFWLSLGIYIVAYIIYVTAAGIIGMVIGIVAAVISYFTTHEINSAMASVSAVSNIFSYCFYIVFYVAVCLNYYSLAEKADGFGMMKRLEGLGSVNPNDKIEEQY